MTVEDLEAVNAAVAVLPKNWGWSVGNRHGLCVFSAWVADSPATNSPKRRPGVYTVASTIKLACDEAAPRVAKMISISGNGG